MSNKSSYLFILFAVLIAFVVFSSEKEYFSLLREPMKLSLPKGFPTPAYNFQKNKLNAKVFNLGRQLFYDPILSADGSISCGSCHQQIAAFAHIDHALSHGIYGKIGKRNVPALQNLIWNTSYMWDGGVNNLEVQPINPITNPIEMNESLAHVVQKLNASVKYKTLFFKAYNDSLINSERLLKALAQFTGLLISADAKYDRVMAKADTFTTQEQQGFQLYKVKCANCHPAPLFTDNSMRNNGLPIDTALHDDGRATITHQSGDKNKFRVPSLRNCEMTYPYMHDGRFRKLKEVIAHYNNQSKMERNYDRSINKIGTLTAEEQQALVLFLKTLTDKTFLYDRRFADPNNQ